MVIGLVINFNVTGITGSSKGKEYALTGRNSMDNNKITVIGKVVGEPEFAYRFLYEKFYRVTLSVDRNSGITDNLLVMIPEKLLDMIRAGALLRVEGQLKVFYLEHAKSRRAHIRASKIEVCECDGLKDNNLVVLKGYVYKEPVHRTTPLGTRLTELMLAVEQVSGKDTCIPCIVWRNERAEVLEKWDEVTVTGRLQSRTYNKKQGQDIVQLETYEVSVQTIE